MFAGTAMHRMGTALREAQGDQCPVEILVEGRWLHGRVESLDARTVVLSSRQTEPAVVSLERITQLRVLTAPARRPMVMQRLSRS